jgi:hypothetical protein
MNSPPFVPVLSAISDCELAPSAGVTPSGVETRSVNGVHELVVLPKEVTHVYRTKISCEPDGLGAVAPRFVAEDANDTYKPVFDMDGYRLAAFPGVVPSGVETRYVVGTHAVVDTVVVAQSDKSDTKTCGVWPSRVVRPDTRFVASETKATYRPSGLITGL